MRGLRGMICVLESFQRRECLGRGCKLSCEFVHAGEVRGVFWLFFSGMRCWKWSEETVGWQGYTLKGHKRAV